MMVATRRFWTTAVLAGGLAAGMAVASGARAQEADRPVRFEISGVAGYAVGGTFANEDGDLVLDDAPRYGLVLGFPVRERVHVEVRYERQDTAMRREQGTFGATTPLFDVAVQQIHGGLAWEIRGGRLRPFVALSLGATSFDPDEPEIATEWRFSGGLGGGLKLFVNDHLGLRVEGRVLPTITDSGRREIFCRSPAGQCLVGVADVASLWQGAVSAAVVVAF